MDFCNARGFAAFFRRVRQAVLSTKKKGHPRERNRVSFAYLPRQRKISCELTLLLLTDAPPRSNCALPKKSMPPCLLIAAPTTYAARNCIGCAACGGTARRTEPAPLVWPHRLRANARTAASSDPLPSRRGKLPRASSKHRTQQRCALKPSAPATHAAKGSIPPLASPVVSHSLPESESSKTIASFGRPRRLSHQAVDLYQSRKLSPSSSERCRKRLNSILRAPLTSSRMKWMRSSSGPLISYPSSPPTQKLSRLRARSGPAKSAASFETQ